MKQQAKKRTKNNQGEMSLLEHLDELRQRFVKVIIALLVGILIGALITTPTLEILTAPARQAGVELQVLSPTEAIASFFKVSFVLGVVVAMPVILYQAFMYLRPGLLSTERRYILVGIPFASLSFAGGAAFAIFVVIPSALPFLSGFMADLVKHQYSIEYYLTFISNIMLWSGLVFETPLVMFILARLGIVSPQAFAKARRFVIIGAAIGAAIITPTPDALNMLLIMGPFMLLYELGILLAKLAQLGRQRAEHAS